MKGLDKSWSERDLEEIFDQYGSIRSAKISVNPLTKSSNGYGFVWFSTAQAAQRAIKDSQTGHTPYLAFPYLPSSDRKKQ